MTCTNTWVRFLSWYMCFLVNVICQFRETCVWFSQMKSPLWLCSWIFIICGGPEATDVSDSDSSNELIEYCSSFLLPLTEFSVCSSLALHSFILWYLPSLFFTEFSKGLSYSVEMYMFLSPSDPGRTAECLPPWLPWIWNNILLKLGERNVQKFGAHPHKLVWEGIRSELKFYLGVFRFIRFAHFWWSFNIFICFKALLSKDFILHGLPGTPYELNVSQNIACTWKLICRKLIDQALQQEEWASWLAGWLFFIFSPFLAFLWVGPILEVIREWP